MVSNRFLPVFFAGMVIVCVASAQSHHIEVNITVPEFPLETEDAYVCVSTLLPPHPHKLIGVIPHARQEVVHHILLYGCSEPHMAPVAGKALAWRCDMSPVCNGPSTVMYGWGRDAPDLKLPDGVGFSVGEQTGIKYIVAQVHYLAVRPPDDHSGVTLLLKPHAVPYAAGMISYASWFDIPPGKKSHQVENSCCFKSYQPLTMFAARVHTHVLGRRVYMTRETWNRTGLETLVSGDPQQPQSFVPTTRHLLWPGDRLTITCDYDSTSRATVTHAGSTHNDEMCNMYAMVYGKTPYLTMCDGFVQDIRDDSPGALPRMASLELDPSPFWRPPSPEGVPNDPLGAFGDATSVTAGPDGTLWVLYRASGVWQGDTFDARNHITRKEPVPEAVVVHLDPDNGTVLHRWGAGVFYLPHMISVDMEGSVWVVDTGRHQVLKFTPEGKLLMTVGTELTPGSGNSHFCKPTQVSVLRDGSFMVADGYCNSRVVMFDAQGKYVAESVRVNEVVHSLLVDECEGLVYVASREAGTVLALELGGEKRLQLAATYDLAAAGHGQAWALRFGPYGEQLALMWQQGQDAHIVNVRFPQQFWVLPRTSQLSPHDFQLGGAPMQLSGAGDRFFAVYLASVGQACDKQCGPLRKFVAVPPGLQLPEPWELPFSTDVTDIHPGDAILLPHGAVVAAHENKTGGGGGGDDEGGAMVADDYDEDVQDDLEDVADYERKKAAAEEQGREWEQEEEADYIEMATGERPNITLVTRAVPLEADRFEVLMQDKQEVKRLTAESGWAIALVVLLAVLMAVTVVRFSREALTAYMQGIRGGEGGAGGGAEGGDKLPTTSRVRGGGGAVAAPAAAFGKRAEVWAAAEGMLARWKPRGRGASAGGVAGAGGGNGAAAAEVAAARERERLLMSDA